MQTKDRRTVRVQGGTLPPLRGVEHSRLVDLPPAFELTFLCEGKHFKALQRARNLEAASAEAMLELSYQCPDFNFREARLVRAVQVR